MNELIKLNETEINNETVQTVNARELHEFLGVGKVFAAWIRSRLDTLGSIEGQDYIVLSGESLLSQIGKQTEEGSKSRGGHNRLEYFVTLDTAKHLAMMEKNDKGKEIREYFIECEKQLKQIFSPKQKFLLSILEADDELSRAVAINQYEVGYVKPLENKVVEQEEQITVLQPKGKFYDAVVQSETLLDIGEVSKLLNYKGLGRNNLFRYLRENSILNNKNLPYQTYIDRGYFKIVESSWVNPSTKLVEVSIKTVMYQKGIDWLDKLLSEHFVKNIDS